MEIPLLHPEKQELIKLRQMMSSFETSVQQLLQDHERWNMDDLHVLLMATVLQRLGRIHLSLYISVEYFSLLLVSYASDENIPDITIINHENLGEQGDREVLKYIILEEDTLGVAKKYYHAAAKSQNEEEGGFYHSLAQHVDICIPIVREFHRDIMRPNLRVV